MDPLWLREPRFPDNISSWANKGKLSGKIGRIVWLHEPEIQAWNWGLKVPTLRKNRYEKQANNKLEDTGKRERAALAIK